MIPRSIGIIFKKRWNRFNPIFGSLNQLTNVKIGRVNPDHRIVHCLFGQFTRIRKGDTCTHLNQYGLKLWRAKMKQMVTEK